MQFSAARVLDNPSKMITAADEIECVLHILIYYAVRFLHHNVPDKFVGLFLQNYFDASSGMTSTGQLNAPVLKREAMKSGAIMLETYDVFDRLRFKWVDNEPQGQARDANTATDVEPPPPDYDHPLNDLIDTLLSWFRGLYAVNYLDRPSPATDASSAGGPSLPPHRRGKPAVADDSDSESEPETKLLPRLQKRSTDPNRPSPEQEKELRALAENLNGHTHVVALFREACRQSFPSDKGKDKRPERGYVPCSPETPEFSEISGFSDFGPESEYQLDEGSAALSDAPASNAFAELAINAEDSDGEPDEGRAPPAAPEAEEDELEYYDGPREPSPCPARPKRGREDDVVPGDLETSGKRSRC